MTVESVQVKLAQHAYPVRIGADVYSEVLSTAQSHIHNNKKCVAVTSPAIAQAQPDLIKKISNKGFELIGPFQIDETDSSINGTRVLLKIPFENLED